MGSYQLGFIGAGVMGEAIMSGALQAGVIAPGDIHVFDIDTAKLKSIACRLQVDACADLDALIARSDVLLAAVKPAMFQRLLEEIATDMRGKALVSIVAGWNTLKIRRHLPDDVRLLCVMPNMPAIAGEGMSVLSANHTLLPEEFEFAQKLFGSFGETELLDEKYFDIVTGLSGSGPAFVFMFIEAMMQAGVYDGLPAKTARKLAVQTALGAAKVLKSNDKHPAEMRDAVCTPAGTTIEGVCELENRGFNGAVIAAVDKSAKKYRQMANG
jgi:pyrroline-5-carboxylate reductase